MIEKKITLAEPIIIEKEKNKIFISGTIFVAYDLPKDIFTVFTQNGKMIANLYETIYSRRKVMNQFELTWTNIEYFYFTRTKAPVIQRLLKEKTKNAEESVVTIIANNLVEMLKSDYLEIEYDYLNKAQKKVLETFSTEDELDEYCKTNFPKMPIVVDKK